MPASAAILAEPSLPTRAQMLTAWRRSPRTVTAMTAPQSCAPEHVLELPHPSAIACRAGRVLLEASVVPLALFYTTMSLAGLLPAIGASLAWYYLRVARRLCRRERVPATVVVGALLLTIRAGVACMTGSAFLYFLQPVLGTAAVALSFGLSAITGRPLIRKLTEDFLPLTAAFRDHPRVVAFFPKVSLLWCALYLTNAGGTLWLLSTSSVPQFLVVKTVASPLLTGAGIVVSVLWFRRTMRGAGIRLAFARPQQALAL